MKKTLLLLVLLLIILSGCENKEEDEKNEYLAMKSELLENEEFTNSEDINCNITFTLDRVDDENIFYSVVLKNPKENMNDIKAIVVHNYYTEEIFPTIGLFDKKASLIVGSSNESELELSGTIETTDDIDDIDLELKVFIEYIDDSGNTKDIYYKTT